jgi:hypothetical protein
VNSLHASAYVLTWLLKAQHSDQKIETVASKRRVTRRVVRGVLKGIERK